MNITVSQRVKDFLYAWWNSFMFLEIVLYFTPCTLAWPLDFKLGLFGGFTQYLYYPWLLLAKLLYGERNSISTLDPSDDTQFEYFHWITSVVLFAFIALIWAWIQRKNLRQKFDSILVWVWKNALRLELAILMLFYGMDKLIPAQMVVPPPTVQAMRIGDESGFNYLWNFMGFSPIFESIVGIGEFAGGVLLLIPRLSSLGGFLTLAIMLPTALMNYCYDVIVKILSTQICISEITLLWPTIIGLARYFLLRQNLIIASSEKIIHISRLWLRRTLIGIYIAFSVLIALLCINTVWIEYCDRSLDSHFPINGRWIVSSAIINDKKYAQLDMSKWTEFDITVTQNQGRSVFEFIVPAYGIPLSAHYDLKHIKIFTKIPGFMSVDTLIDYHLKGDILTLTSQDIYHGHPAFIVTAKKAQPWPHHPGEFHWFNPAD